MNDIAIRAVKLSKQYKIGVVQKRHDTLRDHLTESFKALLPGKGNNSTDGHRNDTIWSLRDVSFEVKKGEVLGIIGRNGAGKSTLLKILARVTEPTSGEAEIHGRVGSLLEVGTGFHGELSGRENIYLNGAILGMKKVEIDRKFDEIVAFADVEKFIDTPVKRYSSGMYMRLAFAVAAHLETEVLIVDEVLAVGVMACQQKCLGKMENIAKEGRTILFVSHNIPSIQALCQRVLLLNEGQLGMDGSPTQVISRYLAEGSDVDSREVDLSHHRRRSHSLEQAIQRAWIEDGNGFQSNTIPMGGKLQVFFQFQCSRPITNPGFGIEIEDDYGRKILYLNNYLVPTEDNTFTSLRRGMVCVAIPSLPLIPGTYFINLALAESDSEWVDHVERALAIHIKPADVYGTGKIPDHREATIFVMGNIAVIPGDKELR